MTMTKTTTFSLFVLGSLMLAATGCNGKKVAECNELLSRVDTYQLIRDLPQANVKERNAASFLSFAKAADTNVEATNSLASQLRALKLTDEQLISFRERILVHVETSTSHMQELSQTALNAAKAERLDTGFESFIEQAKSDAAAACKKRERRRRARRQRQRECRAVEAQLEKLVFSDVTIEKIPSLKKSLADLSISNDDIEAPVERIVGTLDEIQVLFETRTNIDQKLQRISQDYEAHQKTFEQLNEALRAYCSKE